MSRSILVNSSSLEVIFEGNLRKAPPLNRRGRKKWHERYFILRANRTFECYKSQKAAESQKSPRRIVDLRECINLEVGLEYKNIQHIISLGTFKRTFFYAAPSDPLMLQWVNVLERAKNASDGDSVEVLDIGLRKTKNIQAVHNVKSVFTSPKRDSPHVGSPQKSTMTLADFTRGSTDTMDLRLIDSRQSSSTSEGTQSPKVSVVFSGDEKSLDGNNEGRFPSIVSEYSTTSSISSPSRVPSSHVTSKGSHVIHPVPNSATPIKIPNKVPPPSGILMHASRDKNGFFIHAAKKSPEKKLNFEENMKNDSQDEEEEGRRRSKQNQKKEFIIKEGSLKRSAVVKGSSSETKRAVKFTRGRHVAASDKKTQSSNSLSPNHGATMFHSNLKRSFRYRKITMRAEKPLFADQADSDSEDDSSEKESPSHSGSRVPGPSESSPPGNKTLLNADLSDQEVNDSEDISTGTSVVQRRLNLSHTATTSSTLNSYIGHSPANSYSKVTVVGNRRSSSSSTHKKRPLVIARSNSLSATYPYKEIPVADTSPVESLSQENEAVILPPPNMFAGNEPYSATIGGDDITISHLPARPSSSSFIYCSQNSLDNVLVSPPELFRKIESPEDSTQSEHGDEDVPKQHKVRSDLKSSSSSVVVKDRDSTESSDTGYTSSTSPGYQEHNNTNGMISNRKEEEAKTECNKLSELREDISPNGSGSSTPKSNLVHNGHSRSVHSLTSISSDISRFYIPLVFYSSKTEGSGVDQDPNHFTIQVCLVENSDELLKDLVSLKSLEYFSLVDCDEIHGEENVAASQVDDFTVETSLEDLEFGFSVIKNTQKDLFMRKVRQFTFEISNLFGTSKPFSCDVEIRHADQLTVLPIEVM